MQLPNNANLKIMLLLLLSTVISQPLWAADEDAAKALAKANNCFTCHAVDKQKVGPAWNAIAAKYKGDAQAQDKLSQHLTTGGASKSHMIVKAEDASQIKNLVDWLLAF